MEMSLTSPIPSGKPTSIKPVPFIFDPEERRRSDIFFADNVTEPDLSLEDFFDCYRKRKHDQSHIACVNDDKDLFLKFLNTYPTEIDQVDVWGDLFMYDSIKCVTAVLDGETKGLLVYPPRHTCEGLVYGPMRLATDFGSYRLAKLFLDREGSDIANIRDFDNKLPLNYALEPLNSCGEPTKSILGRLMTLLDFDHGIYLETARILAYHTRDVQQEFIKYAMEGSVHEITGLLLVVPEKVIHLCSELRNQILENVTLLLVHDVRSALTSGSDYLTQKRLFLQVTLAIFEIFEKLGDKLSTYLSVPKEGCYIDSDVINLLESEGICPNNTDEFASAISFSSLSELFTLQEIILSTSAIKHESDIQDGGVNDLEGVLNPKVQVQYEEPICADDSQEFVNLVAYRMKKEYLTNKSMFLASEVLRSICYHNSVECATILLEGKTDLRIELNAALEDGMYPLHLATINLSPSLTELFLRHGAHTNVQCNNTSSQYHGMFPLELALEALCFHRCVGDWMPTKSIYKLIYIFCLPELMGPLKTIELLATDISVVKKISSLCVQEGKLVELSALLMVSWDKLMLPGHDGDITSSFIGKYILKELHMLLNEESKLVCIADTDRFQQVRRKKGGLLSALSILELFRIARPAIQDYRLSAKVKDVANFEVPLDVSNLLRDLGFCLKSDDVDVNDIKCLLREVESDRSNVAIANDKDGAHTVKPYITPRPSDDHEMHDNEVQEHAIFFPMLHSASPLAFRSFWAAQSPRTKVPPLKEVKGYGIFFPMHRGAHLPPLAFRSFPAWQSPKTTVPSVNRLIYLASQPSIARYATYGTRSFLASSAKRLIRFM